MKKDSVIKMLDSFDDEFDIEKFIENLLLAAELEGVKGCTRWKSL